jgi:hypothetical protein
MLQALAQQLDTSVRHEVPGPVTRRIVERLHAKMLARALTGEPTMCDHLSYTAPTVALWPAFAPGRLRCPACADRVVKRIRGTVEDRRCDGCGRVVPKIHPCATQIPSIVVDVGALPLASLPPILVQYGLCHRCYREDDRDTTGTEASA